MNNIEVLIKYVEDSKDKEMRSNRLIHRILELILIMQKDKNNNAEYYSDILNSILKHLDEEISIEKIIEKEVNKNEK